MPPPPSSIEICCLQPVQPPPPSHTHSDPPPLRYFPSRKRRVVLHVRADGRLQTVPEQRQPQSCTSRPPRLPAAVQVGWWGRRRYVCYIYSNPTWSLKEFCDFKGKCQNSNEDFYSSTGTFWGVNVCLQNKHRDTSDVSQQLNKGSSPVGLFLWTLFILAFIFSFSFNWQFIQLIACLQWVKTTTKKKKKLVKIAPIFQLLQELVHLQELWFTVTDKRKTMWTLERAGHRQSSSLTCMYAKYVRFLMLQS